MVGSLSGQPLSCRERKLSAEQRDGRARPVPAAPARGRRARAGDKDNTTKKWRRQKAAETATTGEISTVGLRRAEKRKELSVCLFGLATAEK